MDSFLIPWNDGNGNIVISNNGGEVLISSDTVNKGIERQQTLTFKTTKGNAQSTLVVTQNGRNLILTETGTKLLLENDNFIALETE